MSKNLKQYQEMEKALDNLQEYGLDDEANALMDKMDSVWRKLTREEIDIINRNSSTE